MVVSELALTVRVSNHLVGSLRRDREGGVRFFPDTQWLDGGQHPPLGLALLQEPRPPVLRGRLPAWFENLLPDVGSPLRSYLARRFGLREVDSPALLSEVGADLPGAVEVSGRLDEGPEVEPPGSGGVGGMPAEKVLRFSLAGLQLKLSMIMSGDRFTFPARGQDGRWIVKVPGSHHPDLPAIENATMNWARAAGFPVPRCLVLKVEDLQGVPEGILGAPRTAFAVARFDREADRRVHQEDFAQALGVLPEDKYQEHTRNAAGYDGLSLLVRDACGPEEQAQFIERLAFVLASGNDDAHLKNWSFQWGHGHRPTLSPMYDQVATVAWSTPASGELAATLALAMARTKRFRDIDRAVVAAFARRGKAPDGEERFLAALERIRQAWPVFRDTAPAIGVRAVRQVWEHVPLLRSIGNLA